MNLLFSLLLTLNAFGLASSVLKKGNFFYQTGEAAATITESRPVVEYQCDLNFYVRRGLQWVSVLKESFFGISDSNGNYTEHFFSYDKKKFRIFFVYDPKNTISFGLDPSIQEHVQFVVTDALNSNTLMKSNFSSRGEFEELPHSFASRDDFTLDGVHHIGRLVCNTIKR